MALLRSKNNLTAGGFTIGEQVSIFNSNFSVTNYRPGNIAPLFSQIEPPNSSNIITGDKSEENKFNAVYIIDWGDDIFDGWGFFFIYDVSTQKYYFPLLNPLNSEDGIITTQIFNAFNRTFTIKHGYPVRGIFKFDITVDDNLPFRFGAYGDLGSDGRYDVTDIIVNKVNFNLYYHKEQEIGRPIETFYTYVIPKKIFENQAVTYNRISNGTDCSIISNEVTNGLLFYISKTNDVIEWIINDLEIVQPVQTGGDPIICPFFGPKFELAKHIKYVNLLADYTNKIFINAEVDMLELNDFPDYIYYDKSFSLTKTLSHIYKNTYYRKFFVYYNGESIEINADSLEIIYLTKINKLKVAKYQPKKGINSVTFDKTYPLFDSTNGLKIGLKNYLLTIVSDINTDDRHFMELLDVKNIDLPNCSGALISKDLILRISDLYGKELFEFDSNPFNSNNQIKHI